jgi:hypothetical protein
LDIAHLAPNSQLSRDATDCQHCIRGKRNGAYLVRRSGRQTSADIHATLFAAGKARRVTPIDTKQAIRTAIRKRHAGR